MQTIQTMDLPGNDLENGLAASEHVEVYNERDLPCRTCKAGMRVYIYNYIVLFKIGEGIDQFDRRFYVCTMKNICSKNDDENIRRCTTLCKHLNIFK